MAKHQGLIEGLPTEERAVARSLFAIMKVSDENTPRQRLLELEGDDEKFLYDLTRLVCRLWRELNNL